MDKPKPRLTPGVAPGVKQPPPLEEIAYVPTAERLKLEPVEVSEEDVKEARANDRLAWIMLAVLLVGGTLVGINIAMTPPEVAEEEQVAHAEDQTPPPDSTAHGDSAASTTPETPEQPTKPEQPAKPPPTTTKPPVATTTPTTTPPVEAPPATPFGIVVGSYLNEARAQEEATKLKGSTSLDAKIETFDDGGVPSFRIVLGSFPSRAAAQKKANDLISQDLVYEARVAPLK